MEREKERKHPPWEAPKTGLNLGLEVYNSLTSSKGIFSMLDLKFYTMN